MRLFEVGREGHIRHLRWNVLDEEDRHQPLQYMLPTVNKDDGISSRAAFEKLEGSVWTHPPIFLFKKCHSPNKQSYNNEKKSGPSH